MIRRIPLIALGLLAGTAAWAGPSCNVPREQWMPEAQFKAGLEQQGYQISTFKVSKGQCYEIYGRDKSGQRVEIYFDPKDGHELKRETKRG